MADVDLETLDGFLRRLRPAWWAKAACRGSTVNFFPERGESLAEAKALCEGCAAREECLAFAQEERIDHGIWGGLSPRRRKAGAAPRTDRRVPFMRAPRKDRKAS